MSYDINQLGSDESYNRSSAAGQFERGLRDLIYEGLVDFSSSENDIDQGVYHVDFHDGTTGQVQFEFTESGNCAPLELPCHWNLRNRELRVVGQGPQGQVGTWADALTWVSQTAEAAKKWSENQPFGIS